MTENTKALKGFALLSLEERKVVSSKGGKAMESKNRSFSRSRDLAVAAGRKGGMAIRKVVDIKPDVES